MTAFWVFVGCVVAGIPLTAAVAGALVSNARTNDDATYARLCAASFGARIPMTAVHDRRGAVAVDGLARLGSPSFLPDGEPNPAPMNVPAGVAHSHPRASSGRTGVRQAPTPH